MARGKNWYLLCLLLFFFVALILLTSGLRHSANKVEAEKTSLTIDIAPENVHQIEVYWNYEEFSVNREDNANAVNDIVSFLNGEYVLFGIWNNLGTGSGNRVDLYDEAGDLLTGYRIYNDHDDGLSIGTSDDYEYRKEATGDQDIWSLIEVITNR